MAKKATSLTRAMRKHVCGQNFPTGQLQEVRESHMVYLLQTQSGRSFQSRIWHHKRSQNPFLFQPPLQLGPWQHQQPFWHLQGDSGECQPAGRGHLWDSTLLDWAQGVKASQLCLAVPAQRAKIPKGGTCHGVSKGHGAHGHPWCWHPQALCRLHLLSLVWKGGAKWGNSGKPFKDNPLLARSHVRPLF